jgi:hypothetical protein
MRVETEAKEPSLGMKQKILYQAFIAFGQGTGGLRVHRTTCQVIHDHYSRMLDQPDVNRRLQAQEDLWGQAAHGAQALERVRATGRLAALLAIQQGRTDIEPEDFDQAAKTVARGLVTKDCAWCPPPPQEPPPKGAKS